MTTPPIEPQALREVADDVEHLCGPSPDVDVIRAAADALDRAALIEAAARAFIAAERMRNAINEPCTVDELVTAHFYMNDCHDELVALLAASSDVVLAATARPSARMETAD